MKNQGYFSCDELVAVPQDRYNIIHPEKSSHSKQSLNEKLKAVLNRSSFDNIIKMLELNTSNIITCIVKMMNAKLLKKSVEELKLFFFTGLNEVDRIKLKKLY